MSWGVRVEAPRGFLAVKKGFPAFCPCGFEMQQLREDFWRPPPPGKQDWCSCDALPPEIKQLQALEHLAVVHPTNHSLVLTVQLRSSHPDPDPGIKALPPRAAP